MNAFESLSRTELLGIVDDFAKNWLAHDGLWFLEVEKRLGMELAIECDREAWRKFSAIEAARILKRHNIGENSGLDGLKKALQYRLYARLNIQEIVSETGHSFIFRMNSCRVQNARKRKGLPDFPCKTVGIAEYSEFARAVDPGIVTECLACPPDPHPESYFCAWKFSIPEEATP